MRLGFLVLIMAVLTIESGCRFVGEEVDLVLHNGRIVCLDGSETIAQAVAIRDGKIVAIGKEREILNQYKGRQVHDLAGATVYPGLIDAHSHLLGYALGLENLDLVGTGSWLEVVQIVSEKGDEGLGWIRGRGWDQNDWEAREFPDRQMLDVHFPNTPVVLERIDGHAVIANQAALLATDMAVAHAIPGGEVMLREDGTPTGVLIDGAADSLLSRIPGPTAMQKRAALLGAQSKLVAAGLTTVTDAGLDVDDIALIDSMHQDGQLKLRVVAMANPTEENFLVMSRRNGWSTPRLRAQSFKFYMDGSLGSRGAALLEPYTDRPGHSGLLLQSMESYEAQLRQIHEWGFQAATHAIGDSAARLVLDVYNKVLGRITNDRRWRIEHAQVIHPDDLPKFQSSSIVPSVQPTHATSDMYWAGHRLGRGRIRRAYAYHDLMSQLGWLPLGTDFPVEGIDPRNTFLAAVSRRDVERQPKDGFHLDQALSPKECMLGMTIWAAMASHWENELGSIEIGKNADLVVVDRDWLMMSDPHDVLNSRILATYIDGERVHHHSR